MVGWRRRRKPLYDPEVEERPDSRRFKWYLELGKACLCLLPRPWVSRKNLSREYHCLLPWPWVSRRDPWFSALPTTVAHSLHLSPLTSQFHTISTVLATSGILAHPKYFSNSFWRWSCTPDIFSETNSIRSSSYWRSFELIKEPGLYLFKDDILALWNCQMVSVWWFG